MAGIPPDLASLAVPVASLRPFPGNPRRGDVGAIAESLRVNGQYRPVVVNRRTSEILAGNHTFAAALTLGWDQIAATFVDVDGVQAARIVLADNRTADLGSYDDALLAELLRPLDLEGTGFDQGALDELLASVVEPPSPSVALADRFILPPFTVLDARQGYWGDRKARWNSIGLRSHAGRDALPVYGSENPDPVSEKIIAVEGSTFDPVLCEVAYTWFSRPGARILDPFAGGSVRGVVASLLGRPYVGVDLSPAQVIANVAQGVDLCSGPAVGGGACPMPTWHVGDARNIGAVELGVMFDMILTCPPYFDLEVYGDDPADLSRCADVGDFADALGAILADSAARLNDDRFAVLVMGEARNGSGGLHGLVPATIDAAASAGLAYHNEAILITAASTAALRAARPFVASRKLTRTHQTVLVFTKGDPVAAAEWCGPVDVDSGPLPPEG